MNILNKMNAILTQQMLLSMVVLDAQQLQRLEDYISGTLSHHTSDGKE